MTDFNYLPESFDETADFAVDRIKFGDGYVQRIPQGINNGLRKWSVSFGDKSLAEATAIVDFFVSKMGSISFTWRPPTFTADVRVVCPSYSRPIQNRFINGAFVYNIRASFEETPL